MAMSTQFSAAAGVVGLVAILALSGCSAAENKGGDTTCGEYSALSSSEQDEVIKEFFEQKGESDPANGSIMVSKQSARLFCATAGSDSSLISEIDG